MLKAFKYRMYPTDDQKVLLAKTFGCVRVVYNKSLELKTALYQTEKKGISTFELINRMAKWKQEPEYEWLKGVNSQALQGSIQNLDVAFTNFFRKTAKFPNFKSKSNHQSFRNAQNTTVDWENGTVRIPKFKPGIKTVLHRKFEGEIRNSTVSRDKSGRYFISILVEDGLEAPYLPEPCEETTLGIDLGLKHFAVFSDETKIENPRFMKKGLKSLAKCQRRHSRKKKGSNNRAKARRKLAKAHAKVADQRKDFLHKITSDIVKNQDYTGVAVEDLAVKDMMKRKPEDKKGRRKQRDLSRSISDVGWGMFREMLKYKYEWNGKNFHVIGRFDPSSRLCPCGFYNHKLELEDRRWSCPSCGTDHDRDILAANNIKRFAFREQNRKFVGADCPEFTLGEIGVSRS